MFDRFNPARHFSLKITYPVVVLLLVAIGLIVGIGLDNLDKMLLSQEQEHLEKLAASFYSENDLRGSIALSIAKTIASIPEVQDAFAARDREKLLDILSSTYHILNTEEGVQQAQFHLAPATSFLRLNKPEQFGDDLSSFRFTVLTVNQGQRSIVGLEYGVTGYGFRGVTPVVKDGVQLGSFEIGLAFDQALLEKYKASYMVEYFLLIPEEDAANAFQLYASTLQEPLVIDDAILTGVFTTGEAAIQYLEQAGKAYAVYIAPVRDYSGKIISLVEIAYPRDETLALIKRNQIAMFSLGGGTLVLIALLMLWIINRLTRPLKAIKKAAEKIASVDLINLITTTEAITNGDLTAQFTVETQKLSSGSKDDIGAVIDSYNLMIQRLQDASRHFTVMTENLGNLVGNVAKQAESVASASVRLMNGVQDSNQATQDIFTSLQRVTGEINHETENINITNISTNQMAQAALEVAKGAGEQAMAVGQAAEAVMQLTQLIQQVTQSAKTGNERSFDVKKSVENGSGAVQANAQVMEKIREQVNQSVEKMKVMEQSTSKISMIVDTIEEISSRTNLLALNAAIEAARAGVHGKSFAVVADEIRKLAVKSSNSTREITLLIRSIQDSVTEMMVTMKASTDAVEQGAARSLESSVMLKEILTAVTQVVTQVNEITTAAESMNNAADMVASAMESVNAVVEENTASTEQMSAGAESVRQAMQQTSKISQATNSNVQSIGVAAAQLNSQTNDVLTSAQNLSQMAQNLQGQISHFKIGKN